MSKKKLLAMVLVCLFLFVSGVYVFSRLARTHPPNTNPRSDWPAIGPTSPASRSSTPTPPPAPPPPASGSTARKESVASEPGFLLRPGETLEYSANLPKLNSTVADLRIVVAEKRDTAGKGAWHLQAFAHTDNPYRMVFPLDDQFDSYSDSGSMTSLQYEMHLNERGQKVDSVERMLDSANDPVPEGISAVRVLPGTRDPLGVLEYLRGWDWSRTSEVRSPVFDGHKLYDVRAVLVAKSAPVDVPAGKFNTTKIEIHVIDNGQESKDAHFLLYLTNDTARLPVLLEAVLPVATARVELTKAK
jgi:Protein of unknown function (DUF3108)